MKRPPSPKPNANSELGRARWYPYYAGYSPEFVKSMLDAWAKPRSLVLDPWNGSGTTTAVCSLSGISSVGLDLNPAMAVVAKARLLSDDVSGSIPSLQKAILRNAESCSGSIEKDDPLLDFFSATTAKVFRAVQQTIFAMLVDESMSSATRTNDTVNRLSSLAAFYLVVLFRVARRMAVSSSTKNPTWTRNPRGVKAKVDQNRTKIFALLEDEARRMASEALAPSTSSRVVGTSKILVGDSRKIDIESSSFDFVLTSPPYCTRIDYAVATRIELAVLGVGSATGFGSLRKSLLGTTTMPAVRDGKCENMAPQIRRLLEAIKNHPSKASSSYYHPTFADYFDGLAASLCEISRVTKRRGLAVLVVQDSNYKDIHVDLAGLAIAQAARYGLSKCMRWNFKTRNSMRQMHPYAADSSKIRPTESVILFNRT